MPRTPKENERIKREKKEKILAAGLRVFAERGLAAARMNDIAKAAGVSYGLVYNYFSSKEKLFVELVNSGFSSSRTLVAEMAGKRLPPLERIRATFIRLYDYHSADPAGGLFFRTMMQLTFYPRLWKKLAVKNISSDPVFQFLLDAVKEGQQSGEIVRRNPREIVLLLGYLALGFSLRGQEMLDSSIRAESVADLIVRMIRA
jgi:AcrR family transcriptional regulator